MDTSTELKTPKSLSDFFKGTVIEINSNDFDEDDIIDEDPEFVGMYPNPCGTSFKELREQMEKIDEGIYKMVKVKPKEDAIKVDLRKTRITYHYNLYLEGKEEPFDSTYLNGRRPKQYFSLTNEIYLEGVVDALSSMAEGEQSIFIISYKKMFLELGCEPRVPGKADILADLTVLKVEIVGDQAEIDKILKGQNEKKKFADLKVSIEETWNRAKTHFSDKNYKQAIRHYRAILQNLPLAEATENEKELISSELFRAHKNLAVCHMLMEDYQKVLQEVSAAEKIRDIEKDAKLLHAKGRALMKLGELEKAAEPLKKAHLNCPSDKKILATLEEYRKRKADDVENTKAFSNNFMKAFNNLNIKD